ncbi:hypothetical protein HY501_01750, partial [Candidatus Woesearchaeota archaeon]|nr:hypothetical protein [Candidatus Woesearchaeota archaeon]
MAGMAARDHDGITVLRYAGFVDTFKPRGIVTIFGKDEKLSLGHVRYKTKGTLDLREAHPHYTSYKKEHYENSNLPHIVTFGATIAAVHNGQITNYRALMKELDIRPKTDCDSELFPLLYEKNGGGFKAIEYIMEKIPAAYTTAILDRDGVWVMRDPLGMRPGWIGKDRKGRTVVTSEDQAIKEIGGEPIEEIKPGSALFIPNDPHAGYESHQVIRNSAYSGCIFELQYLLDPDSAFHGRLAKEVREELGRELYRVFPFTPEEVDGVSYLPHSPLHAAKTYSEASGIPFIELFYKKNNRRAFL